MAGHPWGRSKRCGPRGMCFAAGGIALSIAAMCSGCGKRNAYVPPPPPEVVVATPEVRTVTLYHEFPGTTQASQNVNIIPRVQGYIDSLHFADGSMVTKDQLLFVIDPRPYQDAYEVALAQVEVNEAAYNVAKANYARALQVAKTPGAIAKQEVDTYKATEEQAKANLKLAQANAANAKLNVDFCYIHAPLAGKISRRLVDVGNLVTANTTVLTSIDQYDPMYAYFNVSEADFLAYLKRQHQTGGSQRTAPSGPQAPKSHSQPTAQNSAANDPLPANGPPAENSRNSPHVQPSADSGKHAVEMGLSDETGYPHAGMIDFADNTVNPATGTLLLRGVFANPPPYVLAPGLFVRIRVPIGVEDNAILVPDPRSAQISKENIC